MPIDFSQIRVGQVLQIAPSDKTWKLFLERQGYYVGQNVQVTEISEPIPSFNPRTGGEEIYLAVTVTNGGRPLQFDVRESEGYTSQYFA
ncbi:hypothetical protein [Gorillibacterium sp. sgz5001074]|uniref:hypothetical protein n=1 Tax=Gorillibacterium sp. sgz5001074 TaxID=3446695 RepID=UPI003F678C50